MKIVRSISRRGLLRSSALAGAGLVTASGLPVRGFAQTTILSESARVAAPYGAQVGDLRPGSAIIWSKADRPARMVVSWSTSDTFTTARGASPVNVLEDSNYTGKVDLLGLPADQRIFYRVDFTDLGDLKGVGEPVMGSFLTPPETRRTVKFVWSGDTAGQGWGINPDFGGMRIYEAMRQTQPDFFIHSGDTIYADGPID
ncbi:MAG: PhoD-like phosphatase N-terminal domain-containing protein, partial [Pseudomonadota bacterium]